MKKILDVQQGEAPVITEPLVSVVTAIYNGRAHVAGCLESVLAQNYPHVEHLIFDAGSTDGTLEVLQKYDKRIAYWKSEPDMGIYDAWNKAIRMVRGEWICFLGVDDEFLPNAISSYMKLARNNPEAEFLSSKVAILDPSGYVKVRGNAWTWREFSRWMCTPHVGSMHHRSLYERLGVYNLNYRITADYEFLLRARGELKTAYLPSVTVQMRDGGISTTRQALREQAIAKVVSGGRNKVVSSLELGYANAKFLLRPLRYGLGRLRAAWFS